MKFHMHHLYNDERVRKIRTAQPMNYHIDATSVLHGHDSRFAKGLLAAFWCSRRPADERLHHHGAGNVEYRQRSEARDLINPIRGQKYISAYF
ncbi:hypothetical protein [Serratia sp. AKBS12]|uniref:hypothetical protein n=1 Tax=Serratia sp. AKBS12 TaxID=2974597 RepID=UPI002166780C|nr:hypothetical protein [Serratia sp. AKBS12]MCS3408266.1 hypothetical protein [Serratia sp. AKBS12]HEI8864597.1 hypothetical protein [Serratia odorifera]HEI8869105.1 hypothetical protein [Serratia odorifera]